MANFLKSLLAVAAEAGKGAAIGRLDELKAKAEKDEKENIARLNNQFRKEEITMRDTLEGGREASRRKFETERIETQAGLLSKSRREEFGYQLKEKKELAAALLKAQKEAGGKDLEKYDDYVKINKLAGVENPEKAALDDMKDKAGEERKRKSAWAKTYVEHLEVSLDPVKAKAFADDVHGPLDGKKGGAETDAQRRIREAKEKAAKEGPVGKAKKIVTGLLKPKEKAAKKEAGGEQFTSTPGEVVGEIEKFKKGPSPTERKGPPRKTLLTDIKKGVKEYHKPSGPGERRKKMEALAKRTGMSIDTILYFIDKIGDKILDMSVLEIEELLKKDQP